MVLQSPQMLLISLVNHFLYLYTNCCGGVSSSVYYYDVLSQAPSNDGNVHDCLIRWDDFSPLSNCFVGDCLDVQVNLTF